MKIRKVKDKPVKLHTKRKPRLKIRRAKPGLKKVSTQRFQRTDESVKRKGKKAGAVSIVLKKRSLYTMCRMGANKVADQTEGGEELKESAGLAAFALSPVSSGMGQAKKVYQRKKLQPQSVKAGGWRGKENACESLGESKGSPDVKALYRARFKRTGNGRNSDMAARGMERRRQAVKVKGKRISGISKPKPDEILQGKPNSRKGFVKTRMLEKFLAGKRQGAQEKQQQSIPQSIKETVKAAPVILLKKLTAALLPGFLGMFSLIALVGLIVVVVVGVIYNSPLSVFFPLPDTGYENPRAVLSSYYMEFNQKVMGLEENGDGITYQNTKNSAPVSNFNDTLMVYMVLYGDGKAGFLMDESGKANLKKVFDEMNYIDSASSAVEKQVGDSIGMVWVTAYCPCSICCGPYANGITASGKAARARHTIAVDAYNPIVPMGTKVVIEGVEYTVEDTGDLNHYGNDFDIFYAHHADCGQWGHRHVEAYLAEGNANTVMVTSSGTTVHNLTFEDYIKKGSMNGEQERMLRDMMGSELWDTYYSSAAGQAVAELAMTKVGCNYSQGRRMEEGYYDCSSLVYRLYKEVGIELPGIAADQGQYCYQNAMLINREDLKPGDLVFYSYEENGAFRNISHVAIYVGDGMMVHAANTDRGVVYDALRDGNVVFYARPYK